MPGAKELSTVEWHRAHSMPTEVSLPPLPNTPLTPTTALSFSRASVVAGSFRLTLPSLRACLTDAGRASTSTFRPTARAVLGLTPGPTPPFFFARDGLVQVQDTAPEGLVVEGVEAERVLALADQAGRGRRGWVRGGGRVPGAGLRGAAHHAGHRHRGERAGHAERERRRPPAAAWHRQRGPPPGRPAIAGTAAGIGRRRHVSYLLSPINISFRTGWSCPGGDVNGWGPAGRAGRVFEQVAERGSRPRGRPRRTRPAGSATRRPRRYCPGPAWRSPWWPR